MLPASENLIFSKKCTWDVRPFPTSHHPIHPKEGESLPSLPYPL